jgi:long-chain acyl-CoA synthetase
MALTQQAQKAVHHWPSTTIGDTLRVQAETRPDKEAVVFGDTRLTYRALHARSQALEEQLLELGVKKSERVGVLYPNHPDFIPIFFAVVNIGAVVVPINPMLKSSEIAHILSDSGAKAVIVHEKLQAEVLGALLQLDALEWLIVGMETSGATPPAVQAPMPKVVSLTGALKPLQEIMPVCQLEPSTDLALLVYTSGTTGKPKGAMLTHDGMMNVFPFNIFSALNMTESDRIIGLLPMCHIYGIGALVCTPVAMGSTVVIMPKFDAAAVLKCMEMERVTVIPAVPAMYQFLLMAYDKNKADLSALRLCMSAAAPISPEVLERIHKDFGAQAVEGYGMSETAGGGTVNPPGSGKRGSIGVAIPGVSLAILDDEGKRLPAGRENVGEIAIQGCCVMTGYYNQPQATEEAIVDGWLRTGDLGCCDEDGYVYIVGRKKELIIRGGQNIYPRELEEVIALMAGVADVAVIGVPDELMGERVKAFIVKSNGSSITEESVKQFCEEHLAPYKVPRLVEFISELPRNSTGKILKRLLE